MTLLILAMAGALAGAPPSTGTAVSGVAVTTSAPEKPTDDSTKIVCRNDEITGSRFTQRICRTKAEWKHAEDIAASYRREVDDRQGLAGKQSGPFGN